MTQSAARAGSTPMTMSSRLSPSTQAHMERKLARVEAQRAHAPDAGALTRRLAEMQSSGEQIRARTVRQVCPCRMPWEVFDQMRPMAKRPQHDPSPLVRANARHMEDEARELAALEALRA